MFWLLPLSLSKKSFRQAAYVFQNFYSSEKQLIENERHPSWVSFVTIFLPVFLGFWIPWQSKGKQPMFWLLPLFYIRMASV